MTRAKTRLCFLIRQLNEGGAQRQIVELVKGLDQPHHAVTVVSLYSGGRFSADVAHLPHVSYFSLAKHGRWDVVPFLYRLVCKMRCLRPDVIHGYLPAANVLCITLKPFLPRMRTVWGIRASVMDWAQYDWLDRLLFQLQRVLARFVDLIIVNSNAGRDYHVARGFPASKIVVIPNGIDTHVFVPNGEERQRVRTQWGITDKEKLIGFVARLDPMKDHSTFLHAAALLTRSHAELRFVCVGDGPPSYRDQLLELTKRLQLADRIIWERWRTDMPAIYNALDIATLCSYYGEGFPNVIGEAMACGVPCVATEVGDSAYIVGDTGVIVRSRDPEALANAWQLMLRRRGAEGPQLGERARCRIIREFDREKLAKRTLDALEKVL